MNVSQLTMRDLEYLVSIEQTLHFGRASEELGVSQPTLSEQIKKLENLLGVKLFERTNRSVMVTEEGRLFVKSAKRILEEAKYFVELSRQKQMPLSGEFHLGAIATVGPYYFPHILPTLLQKYPQLDLIVHEGMTQELLKELDEGRLDALIASHTFDDKKYRLYNLYFEPFLLASPQKDKIRSRLGKVSVKDLQLEKLVLLKEGNCLKDEIVNFCSTDKRLVGQKIQAASLETLRHLVASGHGPSLFPRLAVSEDAKLKGLVEYYPFTEKKVGRQIVLVTRESYPYPENIRLLHKALVGLNERLPLL